MKPTIIKDIISKNHCDLLHKRFLQNLKHDGKFVKFKDETEIILNTKAIYEPYKNFRLSYVMDVNKCLEDLTKIISDIYNKKLLYVNSFIRMYKNGSDLGLHTDRNGLDITLSVNVGGLENWPLNISNISSEEHFGFWKTDKVPENYKKYKNDYTSYFTEIGTGIVCSGKYPHWRNTLSCNDKEYVLQIFYHWSIKN